MMPVISDSSSTVGSEEGPTSPHVASSTDIPEDDRTSSADPHPSSTGSDCAGCGGCILDRYYLLAVDRKWHTSCLKCVQCKVSLDSEVSCFTRNGRIYCKDDYYKMFAVKRCTRCGQDIFASDLVMRVKGDHVYHLSCFTCAWCNVSLVPGDYFGLIGNLVYCRSHFNVRSSSVANDHFLSSSEQAIHPASLHSHYLNHPQPPHLHHHHPFLDHHLPPLDHAMYGYSSDCLSALAGVTDSVSSVGSGCSRGGNLSLHHHHLHHPSSLVELGHVTPTNSPSAIGGTSAHPPPTPTPPTTTRKGRPRKRKIPINSGVEAGDRHHHDQHHHHLLLHPPSPSSNAMNASSSVYCSVDKDMPGLPLDGGGPPSSGQTPQPHNLSSCDSLYINSDGSTSSTGQGANVSGGRTKRMRTSFKHHQLRTMKQYFAINQNPDAKDLKALAQKTNLSKRVLQVWFQNARAKWRRNNLKMSDGGMMTSQSSFGMTPSEATNPSSSPTPSPNVSSHSPITCLMYES